MTPPIPEPGAASRVPDADRDFVQMWRLVAVSFGGPIEAHYGCVLCSDSLDVPRGGVHPAGF